MPRYMNQPKLTYTDASNRKFVIREMRSIPKYVAQRILRDVNEDTQLDEVAARSEIFSAEGEVLTYLLFDANVRDLLEADFNVAKLRQLIVPVVQE